MYKVVKILTDSITPGVPHNGVHQWCTVQTMCSDRIPCCRERVNDKRPQLSCNVYGSAVFNRSTVDGWVERMTASEERKADLHVLPCWRLCTVVSLEMLQHTDVFIPEDWRITCQKIALTLLISQGSVSQIIRGLGYLKVCMRKVHSAS